MPVQMSALALVIEQAMTVTKIDLAADLKHERVIAIGWGWEFSANFVVRGLKMKALRQNSHDWLSVSESFSAFAAFVAAVAMQALPGSETTKRQRDRGVWPIIENVGLGELIEGANELHRLPAVGQGVIQCAEKRLAGVFERVVVKRRQSECRDLLLVAPQCRFHGQQSVSTGQMNGFVGSGVIGGASTGDAPMIAIQFGDRHVEFHQRTQPLTRKAMQNRLDGVVFGRFPIQAATNKKRRHRETALKQRMQQDGAVDTAAKQQPDFLRKLVLPIHASYFSRNLRPPIVAIVGLAGITVARPNEAGDR